MIGRCECFIDIVVLWCTDGQQVKTELWMCQIGKTELAGQDHGSVVLHANCVVKGIHEYEIGIWTTDDNSMGKLILDSKIA